MTDKRPHVTVVYQDAEQQKMGCLEAVLGVVIFAIIVFVFLNN